MAENPTLLKRNITRLAPSKLLFPALPLYFYVQILCYVTNCTIVLTYYPTHILFHYNEYSRHVTAVSLSVVNYVKISDNLFRLHNWYLMRLSFHISKIFPPPSQYIYVLKRIRTTCYSELFSNSFDNLKYPVGPLFLHHKDENTCREVEIRSWSSRYGIEAQLLVKFVKPKDQGAAWDVRRTNSTALPRVTWIRDDRERLSSCI